MKQYVIIGNGVAAVGCIEGIRCLDKKSKIIYASKGRNDLGRYDYEKVMH